MVSIDQTGDAGLEARASANVKFYGAAWRWHFYAGLYVIPFLLVLATTGMIMQWTSVLQGRDGEWVEVPITAGTPLPVSQQAEAARAAVDGDLRQYIAPRADDLAAIFRVDRGEDAIMVAVDPYTATVLDSFPRRSGLYDLADDIHGTLLIGTIGDRAIEAAASLALVMIATGLYLWWPRNGGTLSAFIPSFSARGRALWKNLHSVIGVWISLILVVFLISGLSWAGIWGEKMVQAWSTFPAEKWDNVPLSDDTHASMNHAGRKEVPWALEQTPMPVSGSDAGIPGIPEGQAVSLDSIVAFARQTGFDGRFQLAFPRGDQGVWTLSRDSMSNDSEDPTSDRTMHLDRYTGKVLADVGFADYSIYGQGMAVGIAFHEGDLGAWNVALNTVFCLSVVFLCVSGIVMWWKRRPARALRLAAPPMPRDMPLWQGAVLVGLAVSLAFPMAGIALLSIIALDVLVLRRLPALKRALS